jgi:hypothetical protein
LKNVEGTTVDYQQIIRRLSEMKTHSPSIPLDCCSRNSLPPEKLFDFLDAEKIQVMLFKQSESEKAAVDNCAGDNYQPSAIIINNQKPAPTYL